MDARSLTQLGASLIRMYWYTQLFWSVSRTRLQRTVVLIEIRLCGLEVGITMCNEMMKLMPYENTYIP